ncbi:hypothetical protein [Microbulbifer sp. GL-2]|uniref:hypothetical protein n=1 Tax=Microbulbifer sp. GL-2 TaxID=2591606 RepID=UPI00116321C0|nr:hypothetical protein [Microbulbifer sp. GL-2]BBM03489.1 hypothetical protein GL2_35630 [Microbulbifer sp. GL-2]
MQNSYQVSESTVENEIHIYKPSIVWKILFFLLVPLEIWSQYEAFVLNEYNQSIWWLAASLFIYITYFVGFYGLAFAKKIATRKFWGFFLPVIMATDIYEVGTVVATMNMAVLENQMILLFISPIMLLLWFVIFRYRNVLRYIK